MKRYRIIACYFIVLFLMIPTVGFTQCSDQDDPTYGYFPDHQILQPLDVYDKPARFSILRGGVVFGAIIDRIEPGTCVQLLEEVTVGVASKWWLVRFRHNNEVWQGWILAATQLNVTRQSDQFEFNLRRVR